MELLCFKIKEDKVLGLPPYFHPRLLHKFSYVLVVTTVGRSIEILKERTTPKVVLVVNNLPLL